MKTAISLTRRLTSFFAVLLTMLTLIFGVLPLLTNSVDILQKMSITLADNDIDPSRYYYTDVAQVAESESYLETALARR